MIHILRPGDVYEYVEKNGAKHTVSISRFLEHDHEHLTVYNLDFPLSEEDIEQEKNALVISILGFGFSEPYTGTLDSGGMWFINECAQGELFFVRPESEEYIGMHFVPIEGLK